MEKRISMNLEGAALKRALEELRREARESYEAAQRRLVERQEEARLRLREIYDEVIKRFVEKLK